MKHQVVAPSVGESVTEVSILKWNRQSGEAVKTGEQILEIESDKATVEIIAEHDGVLNILKNEGETIPVGEVIAEIDDAAKATVAPSTSKTAPPPPPPSGATKGAAPQLPPQAPTSGPAPQSGPAARKVAQERGVDLSQIQGTGKDGRVTKGDVLTARTGPTPTPSSAPAQKPAAPQRQYVDKPGDRRVPMSRLRQKIAERLVQAQQNAALLTTFNEVDMSAIMALRKKHKEKFKDKHGVNLGFMSFFTKACIAALKEFPSVNAMIDGTDIIYHDYYDIGIAVGTDRGLVVPVIRGADQLGFPDIEKTIVAYATKARDGKLSIAEMSGGTFTISNGGVYGSLLSTPILNPPQSGILGMHKIEERAVVVNGKVEARPMMYVALSYDHRIIDGKESVSFLVTVKDHLENPEKLGLEY